MAKTTATKATGLNDLTSILLSTLDEKTFISELSKHIFSIVECDRLVGYLVEEDTSATLVSRNGEVVNDGIHLKKGEGPAGHVIRTKKPYFSNSVSRDPLFQAESIEGVQAELCIPVSIDGIVIATLHLQQMSDARQFEREHITAILEILNDLRQPLVNMKMYLAAKHLNQALAKKIEQKEKELEASKTGLNLADSYRIQDKDIIGKSDSMKNLIHLADKVAATDVHVLLTGENGTGKEMIARRVHCRGTRKEGGFVSIDCSAMSEIQLEKELFGEDNGFAQGGFTRAGLLETANNGTLFINNIEALTLNIQSKLYKFLVDKMAFRIGGQMPYRSNVRIIAATTKDLHEICVENRFREDLFFMLNTVNLNVPSLRQRKEDIELLAISFLNSNKPVHLHKSLSPGVISALSEYKWPGNVRELQNVMERAFILSDGMIIERNHLSETITRPQVDETVQKDEVVDFQEMTLDELERRHICSALEHLGGNKTKTAKMLGITVKTLYNKLHSYGMIEAKEA
jgi:Nif-specific regulatory protein